MKKAFQEFIGYWSQDENKEIQLKKDIRNTIAFCFLCFLCALLGVGVTAIGFISLSTDMHPTCPIDQH